MNVVCPMCNAHRQEEILLNTQFDGVITGVEVKGLGRGNGFGVIDRVVIDDPETLGFIRNRCRQILSHLARAGPSFLKKLLCETGARVRTIYVEKPYHFTPLSILERNMMLGPLNDSELEKLVLCHIEYVRNYIYRFQNRDRAYYEWVLDKATWPKLGLRRNEIKLLDNLIKT